MSGSSPTTSTRSSSYDGFKPATILEVEPRLRDRTVTMNGCSKAYAMTGWRIGYAGGAVASHQADGQAAEPVAPRNTSSVSQAAAVEALTGPQDTIDVMRAAYKKRRDMMVEELNQAPGLYCHKPEGAFYVFPSMQGCIGKTSAGGRAITDDDSFCAALLEEEGVACVHGTAFMYPGHFRISYATSDDVLKEACVRIQPLLLGPEVAAMPALAQRLAEVKVSASAAMTQRARALRAAGHRGHQPLERRARLRLAAACHRGRPQGGARRRHQIPAAGRHAGAEGRHRRASSSATTASTTGRTRSSSATAASRSSSTPSWRRSTRATRW